MKGDSSSYQMLCYLGIFLLLLFIVLPPLFRIIFPREETSENNDNLPLIMNLTCNKEEDFGDYQLKTKIESNYYEDKIHDTTFTYEIIDVSGAGSVGDITIDEYDALRAIENVKSSENENIYTLKIDYANNDYSNEELLADHQHVIAEQLRYYTDNSFTCNTAKIQ